MSVRAKFRVSHVTDYGNDLKQVCLEAVYDDGIPENQRFSKHTPSGKIEISMTNPAASDQFKPGKSFYLVFTEAD